MLLLLHFLLLLHSLSVAYSETVQFVILFCFAFYFANFAISHVFMPFAALGKNNEMEMGMYGQNSRRVKPAFSCHVSFPNWTR